MVSTFSTSGRQGITGKRRFSSLSLIAAAVVVAVVVVVLPYANRIMTTTTTIRTTRRRRQPTRVGVAVEVVIASSLSCVSLYL